MRFLVDEDVVVTVVQVLRDAGHEVFDARVVFGIRTKDVENVAWARAQNAILVTGDRHLAVGLRQSRKCGCLNLLSLTDERGRVREFLPVIEAEIAIQGEACWMQITTDMYHVGR